VPTIQLHADLRNKFYLTRWKVVFSEGYVLLFFILYVWEQNFSTNEHQKILVLFFAKGHFRLSCTRECAQRVHPYLWGVPASLGQSPRDKLGGRIARNAVITWWYKLTTLVALSFSIFPIKKPRVSTLNVNYVFWFVFALHCWFM
jgi:hypothetical protein